MALSKRHRLGRERGHRLVEDRREYEIAFERFIDNLAQMFELYGPEVLREIEGMDKGHGDSGT